MSDEFITNLKSATTIRMTIPAISTIRTLKIDSFYPLTVECKSLAKIGLFNAQIDMAAPLGPVFYTIANNVHNTYNVYLLASYIIYNEEMKRFDWDPDKNLQLQAERNVSFEDVVTAIASGYLLDVEPGRASYPHQQVYIVALEGYAYMVPHVDEGDTCFLKTIIPSRVHTKHFFSQDK